MTGHRSIARSSQALDLPIGTRETDWGFGWFVAVWFPDWSGEMSIGVGEDAPRSRRSTPGSKGRVGCCPMHETFGWFGVCPKMLRWRCTAHGRVEPSSGVWETRSFRRYEPLQRVGPNSLQREFFVNPSTRSTGTLRYHDSNAKCAQNCPSSACENSRNVVPRSVPAFKQSGSLCALKSRQPLTMLPLHSRGFP